MKKNGFTLIEAMIAMVILSIAVAGLILPFAASAECQRQGEDMTLAAKLAADLAEQIAATDFDSIVSTYGSYQETKGNVKNAAGEIFTDSMYADFSRNAVCEYVYMPQQGNYGKPNFIKVKITVRQNNLQLAQIDEIISR